MWVYSMLMFAAAAVLLVMGTLIDRGNTKLIHDCHQTRVKDKQAYGKAFGRALMGLGAAPFVSGLVALLGDSERVVIGAVIALIAGMALGVFLILKVQKTYNQGLF